MITITAQILNNHWLILIVNERQTHKFIIYATIYCKKKMTSLFYAFVLLLTK